MSKDGERKRGDTPPEGGGHTISKQADVPPKPCCCDEVKLFLKEVNVITETDAPTFPLLSKLIGYLTADHVLITATTKCHPPPNITTWPEDGHAQEVPKGKPQHPWTQLATIKPSAECTLDCEVKIASFKDSRADDILKALSQIMDSITALTAQLSSMKIGGAIIPAFAAQAQAIENQIHNLWDDFNKLQSALFGTKDLSMGEFSINFYGSFQCGVSLYDAMKNNWNPQQIDENTVELTHKLVAHGGEWELTFRAIRTCSQAASTTIPISGK